MTETRAKSFENVEWVSQRLHQARGLCGWGGAFIGDSPEPFGSVTCRGKDQLSSGNNSFIMVLYKIVSLIFDYFKIRFLKLLALIRAFMG